MALIANLTPHLVGELVGLDARGAEFYAAIVKGTFVWAPDGSTGAADAPAPLVEVDVCAGEPGKSGLVAAADLGPPRPRVDVVLHGEIALAHPVEEINAALQIGTRLRKVVRISGDRVWGPGLMQRLALTRPRPFTRMPIVWERSFGGTDPEDPRCWEPRN